MTSQADIDGLRENIAGMRAMIRTGALKRATRKQIARTVTGILDAVLSLLDAMEQHPEVNGSVPADELEI